MTTLDQSLTAAGSSRDLAAPPPRCASLRVRGDITSSRDAAPTKPARDALGPSGLERATRWLLGSREEAIDEVLDLAANTARSFPRSRGLLVEVLEGSVLVTQSGDPDDHVLGAGDRLRFDGRGVAAMAFTPSRMRIRAGATGETVSESSPWNGATFGSSSR